MKKVTITIALLVAFATGFTGCKDFLDIKPVGARFLTDLEAVANTMGAWMSVFRENRKNIDHSLDAPSPWLSTQGEFISYVDVWSFRSWDMRENALDPSEKRLIDRTLIRNDWNTYYELIGLMNLVIIEGKTANGDENLRDILLGEAYIQRAYYFFKLLQYYAPVDDPSLGVVVHLEINQSVAEADLSRKPQSVVYNQILSDLRETETILARTDPDPEFNIMFDKDWIYRIAAQIYHYKACTAAGEPSDWENAIKYSELAMKVPTGTQQLTIPYDIAKLNSDLLKSGEYGMKLRAGYPESLGMLYVTAFGRPIPNTYNYSIKVWNDLYKDSDLRKTQWFLTSDKWNTPSSEITESDISCSRKTNGYPQFFLFRLAEQWLIRIEALAMSGDITGAQAALSTWRSLRYTDTSQLTMPSTAADMQYEVYLERKREFLNIDDMLWLDMKRLKISDTRRVKDFNATLEGNDFRYQFPIPDNELEYNQTIKINPGWAGLIY